MQSVIREDTMDNTTKLAVLIDADNAQASIIRELLAEISRYGTASVKRIYGDWTTEKLKGWKNVLNELAIQPIQQFAYTIGKNATDSSLIIDAMDLLHTGHLNGFCLVSSDSDFTRLATRLREAGMKVIGIGERKTPHPFIVACDKFIYLEIIASTVAPSEVASEPRKKGKPVIKKKKTEIREDQDTIKILNRLITSSITDLADENGWAYLGDVGNLILKKQPDFDPRNYGFPKLTPLIRSLDFEIDERESGQNKTKHIYIRNRK